MMTKDEAVTIYAPLVRKIAQHLAARLPACVQFEDLTQAGMLGLLEAFNNFDQNQAASFSTFASFRIRGAMLDELRKSDWTPRRLAQKMRQISNAINAIEMRTKQAATADEIAAELQITPSQYALILDEIKGCQVFSLDELLSYENAAALNNMPKTADLADLYASELLQEQLSRQIAKLPEREKLIIALYYQDELNFKQIGKVLEVSESRVSQLHSQALARLSAKFT